MINEQQSSAHFINKVGDPLDLDPPSAHGITARMVSRMRKHPRTATTVYPNTSKKRKLFVTDGKDKFIANGFHIGNQKSKAVYTKTADVSKISSEQQIHEENLTCILDAGSEVNLLGGKHLKEFAKTCIDKRIP